MYFTIAVTVKWLLQRDNKNTTPFLVCFYWSMCMHRLGRACTVWDVPPPPTPLHLLMERQHHVREASELEQNEEDELAGEVLPQELTGAAVVKLLLRLGPLHGVHHQIHQLVLQNRTPLLMLQEGRGASYTDQNHCKHTSNWACETLHTRVLSLFSSSHTS